MKLFLLNNLRHILGTVIVSLGETSFCIGDGLLGYGGSILLILGGLYFMFR